MAVGAKQQQLDSNPLAAAEGEAGLSLVQLLKTPQRVGLPQRICHIQAAWDARKSDCTPIEAGTVLSALSMAVSRAAPHDAPRDETANAVSTIAREAIAKIRPQIGTLPIPLLGDIALSCKTLRAGDSALVHAIADGAAREDTYDADSVVGLSRVAHLLAVRKTYVPEFFDALSRNVGGKKLPYDGASFCTFAGAVAELDPSRQGLLAQCIKSVLENKEPVDPNSKRRIERAIAALKCGSPAVARILCGENAAAEAARDKAVPGEVLAWFNRKGYPCTVLANRRADWTSATFQQLTGKELASTARDFQRWGVDSSSVRRRFASAFEKKLDDGTCKENDIAAVIGFLTPDARACRGLLTQLAERLQESCDKIGLKEACSIVRALDYGDIRNDKLFSLLGEKLADGIDHLEHDAIPDLFASFAACNQNQEQFFEKAQRRIVTELDAYEPRQLAVIAWAATKMSSFDEALLTKLFERAVSLADETEPRDAALCAWSASATGAPSAPELTRAVIARFTQDRTGFDELSVTQLYQASLSLGFKLDPQLVESAEKHFEVERQHPPQPNDFEKSVRATLIALGISFKEQHFVAGYHLDFLVEYQGRCYALECDGSEFHRVGGNDQGRLKGNNLIRNQALSNLGIETVRIIDRDWDMRTLDHQKAALILELLGATPKGELPLRTAA